MRLRSAARLGAILPYFPGPLKFDPERENAGRHLAFGRGSHMCLGMCIARATLQEGIHLIAQR